MTLPNTFVNGTLTDADEVNENFTFLDDRGDYQQVNLTSSSISTTSTTWVDMTGTTLTINKTGTYLIMFSADIQALSTSDDRAETYLKLLHNTTTIAAKSVEIWVSGYLNPISNTGGVSIILIADLTLNDILKIQWKVKSGTTGYTRDTLNNGGRNLTVIEMK